MRRGAPSSRAARPHFVAGQDHGQSLRAACAHDPVEPRDSTSSTSRYKNRSALNAWFWVERRRCLPRERRQEAGDLRRPHIGGVALVVKRMYRRIRRRGAFGPPL